MKKYYFVAVICTICFGSLIAQPTDYILFYPFNGDAIDASANTNDGTVVGATQSNDRFNKANRAYGFVGDNYISVPNINLSNQDFTFSLWEQVNATHADGAMFFGQGSSTTSGATIQAGYRAGSDIAFVEIFNDVSIEHTVVSVSSWNHWVFSFNNSNLTLTAYLNGEQVGQTIANSSLNAIGTLTIGRSIINGPADFLGMLDDVKIWDRELAASEVNALHLSENIALEYIFSGNADDQSGNGVQGSLPNGGTYVNDRFGNVTSALDLDGDTQYVSADNSNSPVISGNVVTFSAWINLREYRASSFILSTPGLIALFDENGFPVFAPQDEVVSNQLQSSNTVPLNQWIHYAGTYDGSFSRIYIDGVEVANEQIDKTMNLTNFGTAIGGNASTNFHGSIDDVRIYNKALSASEISNIYSENGWPILSLEVTGSSLTGSANTDQISLADANGAYYLSRYLYDGTLRFQANGTTTLNWGDNELDGIADQNGTDIAITEGLYAIRFQPSDNTYQITEITTVGFIGSARTGDASGWDDPDTDMIPLGQGAFQLNDVRLYDGEWKIRANDDWGLINWGGPGDGTFDYFGDNITVTAGTYDITVSVGVTLNYSITNTGLLAKYSFSGNSLDESGNENNGTLGDGTTSNTFPALTSDRFGNANSAYDFDGVDDYISLGNPSDFDFGSELTISAWVNPTAYSGSIFHRWESGTEELFFVIHSSGVLEYQIIGISPTMTANNVISLNTWTHVILVYDGSSVKFYVDGALDSSVSVSGTFSNANANAYIGANPDRSGTELPFKGVLDDIQIYNRTLSDSEIFSLYSENNWLAPQITAISPTSGAAGTIINVYGDNLNESGMSVAVDGVTVTTTTVTDNLIQFTVPDIKEGAHNFTVVSDLGTSLSHPIQVLKTKTATLSFTSHSITNSISAPTAIHVADINNDNYPDLLVYSLDNADFLYFENDQSGGFPSSTLLYDGGDGTGVNTSIVTNDVDRDGDLDVFIFTATDILWFVNEGSGSFTSDAEIIVASGSNFRDIDLGDLDADGFIDLVASENGILQWYKNDGSGAFGTKTVISTSSTAENIKVVDFDQNGYLDIAQAGNSNYTMINAAGSANFTELPIDTPTNGSDALAAGEFNGDDLIDLAASSFNDHNVDVFLNGGLSFLEVPTDFNSSDTYLSGNDLSVGDFDGDRDSDFLTAFFNSAAIVMYENNGTGSFGAVEVATGQTQVLKVEAIDIDNDGDLDVVVARDDGNILWFENEDNSTTQKVAELNFDGNLLDTSGFGNDGSSGSDTYTTNRFSNENGALDLSAGTIDIGNDSELNLTKNFSMNMWINPTDNSLGSAIFSSAGSFHQHMYSTSMDWRYFQGSTEFPIDGIPVALANNTWTMVTWTYDGSKMRFYENSELKHTEFVSGDIDVTVSQYVIGGYQGAIDEFSWINGVLSQEDITLIYNNDLLVHYAFSGDATDATTNGRDAVVNGASLTSDRFGNSDEAYMFDGGSDIDSPTLSEMPENMTISTWFKYPQGTADNLHYLIDLAGVAGLVVNQNNIESTFKLGANFVTTTANTETETTYDTWYLATATYDGSSLKLYLNGVLAADVNNSDQITYDLAEYGIRMGRPDFTAQDFFLGYMDDVKVFAKALTESEIIEMYNENRWDIADIRSFSLDGEVIQGVVDWKSKTVTQDLGSGFDITNMIASFNLSEGAIATVNGVVQESGVTVNDFTNPLVYVVTGVDGSTNSWVVTVNQDDGLLVYYPFTGNANDVKNGQNGTLVGDVVLAPDRFGNADQAYSFDGDGDFIQTDFNPNDNEAFSISYWTYWDTDFDDFREMLGFTTDDETTKVTYFGIAADDNLRARSNLGVGMPIRQWNHLVFTYDGSSTFQCYLDNTLVFTQNDLTEYPFGPLTIGAFSRNGGEAWVGDLDDIRFYGRVVSVDEINDLFREGGWVPEVDGEFARYSFTGNATDLGRFGYHGTIGNGSDANQDPDLTIDRFGAVDNAYYFDASDFITFPGMDNFDFENEITVAAWINSNAYNPGEPEIISNLSEGSGFDFKLSSGTSNDAIFKTLKAEVPGGGFLITGELGLDTWYHVAFTYTRNDHLRLYVDGVEIGSTAVGDVPIAVSSKTMILGSAMDGTIDELVIYNDALSAESIQGLYFNSAPLSSEKELISFDLSTGGIPSSEEYTSIGTFGSSRYYLSNNAAFWNDAKVAAEAIGGHLAVIHSQEENDFLSDNVSGGAWIGLTDQNFEGEFSWVDGSPLDYDNWNTGEPNGGATENYLEFIDDGTWNDLTDGEVQYIVEVPFHSGVLNMNGYTIDVDLPFGTDPSSLVATYTVSDNASARVNSVANQNSITSNDFTNPVVFSVVAEDQSAQNWVVTTTVDDGLLAFYPFNNNANDESVNSNNATVNGATITTDRFDIADRAYNFNGTSDFIEISNVDFVGGSNQVTVSFWVNTNSNSKFQDVLNYGNLRAYITDGGILAVQLFLDGTANPISEVITPSQWQHFVFTHGDNTSRLYKDGVMVMEETNTGIIDLYSGTSFVGSGNGSNFMDGSIDDIRLYDRAISSAEVLGLYNEGGWPPVSSENDITSFDITGQVGDEVIDTDAHTVSVSMPFDTDVTKLTPVIGVSEAASINPSSGVEQDFTSGVKYTVIAEDLTMQDWNASVTILPNTATDIIAFSINGNNGVIDASAETVNLEVASGTVLSDLVADFNLSDGATVTVNGTNQETGITSNDFTNAVVYSVTAADGVTTNDWTVTVTASLTDATQILSFSFPEQAADATIGNGTIDIAVVFGTPLTALVADFSLSGGASVAVLSNTQTSGVTENDFSSPVTYTVMALDAVTTQDWIVTVTVAQRTGTDIANFDIPNQVFDEVIDATNHTVALTMPSGTVVSSLTPTIDISDGASINPASGVAQDFSGTVAYIVTAENGVDNQQWNVSVTVSTNNEPTDISIDSDNIDENLSATSIVGRFSTSDVDAGDSHSYTLISGTGDDDNTSFNIFGNTLVSTEPFNFEVKSTYSILIQTDDGNGGLYNEVFTVMINNINDLPTDIGLSSSSITEKQSIGTKVGDLTTTDDDTGDSHIYSLIAGTGDSDNGSFSISGTQLLSAEVFDFDVKTSYEILIQTNDGAGGLISKAFVITIDNDNATPSDITLGISSVDENESSGTQVGVFTTTDPDVADSHTYSLISGTGDTDNASFSIDGAILRTAEIFNFEVKSSYSILVQTDDGNGGLYNEPFEITIIDVNDFPTDIELNDNTISENESTGTVVGDLTSVDEDDSNFTYELIGGTGDTDNSSFSIDGTDLVSEEVFDFEVKSSYSILIQTRDADGATYSEIFTIDVVDIDENAPVISNVSSSATYLIGSGGTSVSATITDESNLASVQVFSKKTASANFTSSDLTLGSNPYTHTLEDALFNSLGSTFYFEATDVLNNTSRSDTISISVEVPANTEAVTGLKASSEQLDYSIIAMPYQTVPVSTIFSELLPADKTKWRLLHYNGVGSLQEYPSFNSFEPGKGYWFLTNSATSVNLGAGNTVSVNEANPITISLRSGWNMIGNPYPFTLNWTEVITHNKARGIITNELDNRNGELSVFVNRVYGTSTSLSKYQGAFVNATSAVSNLEIPSSAIVGAGGRISSTSFETSDLIFDSSANDWLFRLNVENKEVQSNVAAVGMHHNALNERDYLDWELLPRLSKYVDITIGDQLSGSIVSNQDYYKWNFKVNSNFDDELIQLNWDKKIFENSEYGLIIIDLVNQRRIDLTATNQYSFTGFTGSHPFELYYGKKNELEEQILSVVNDIGQVFPNPSEGSITIPINLNSQNASIHIKMIDLMGRTIIQDHVDYNQGGYFEHKLNIDELNSRINEGTYILQLELEADGEIKIYNRKLSYKR